MNINRIDPVNLNLLLALLLVILVFYAYQKTVLLKRYDKLIRKYQKKNPFRKKLGRGQASVSNKNLIPLELLIQSFKKEARLMISNSDQVKASNRIFAHNMKQSEKLLDAIPDGILMVDLTGNIILANKAMAFHLDLERKKMLGKPLIEWMTQPEWRPLAFNTAQDKEVEIQIPGPHSLKTLKVSIRWIGSGDDRIGQLFLVKDVTESVDAEQASRDFVSHVSHELKAPLNSLKSYSEMLMDGEADEEETRHLFYNTINEEVDRLAQLVDNLLSITKIEMGNLQIQTTRVKTIDFLNSLYFSAEAQAKGKNISMHLSLPDRLPAMQVDKTLMSVALINLLSNAVKYTDEGGSVSLKAEENEDVIMIHVIDSGIGISEADLKHVFDKFYRSDDSQARARTGHGLGLALSQQIVQLHGGDIQVISHPGKGSQFTVILEKSEDILL